MENDINYKIWGESDLIKKIANFIISGNVSDESYAIAKDDMYNNNVMMLRVLSTVATIIFFVCIILGFTVPNMHSKLSVYIAGTVFSLFILFAAFFLKNRKLHLFCMCFLDVMLLSVGLLITLVSAPEQLTVTLIPIALLVPLFFDVKPVVFLTVVGTADLIYLIFAPMVKPDEILALDMVDVMAFSIAGIIIGTVITKVKIERYVYANRIRKIALQDGLTECYNRKAYEDDISDMTKDYPSDVVYMSMDVNGLKVVNDSLGHEAGDEIILGAAQCMDKCLGKYGKVYRTGGDEFTAILYLGHDKLEEVTRDFENEVSNWHGELVENLAVSFGCVKAEEMQGLKIEEVSALADKRMYDAKTAYYRKKGVDRRGQVDAHKVLCALYTKILKINITDDTYTIVNMNLDEQTKEKGYADTISGWIEGFGKSGQVHPDDLDNYLSKTNFGFMSEYFKQGKTSLSIAYRRKYDDIFKQVMMEIVPTAEYSDDDQSLYLYVKDIDV